jgi:hypothetical protein
MEAGRVAQGTTLGYFLAPLGESWHWQHWELSTNFSVDTPPAKLMEEEKEQITSHEINQSLPWNHNQSLTST